MTDRLHCEIFHDSDGACCEHDETCLTRHIDLRPMTNTVPRTGALWQALLVVVSTAVMVLGLLALERQEARNAVINQESMAWFKIDWEMRR